MKRSGAITRTGIYLLLACLSVARSNAACVVDSEAVIPVDFATGTITVPVEVNGITATFILDTGAQRSVVSEAAIQRLGLARDQWVGTTMTGIGGIERRPNANPRSLALGGVTLVRRTLNHDDSLTVGVLPSGAEGLLGRDFLSLFDLDLDVPHRRLTLYRPHGCTGRFLPWTGQYKNLPVTISTGEAIIVATRLDGKPLRALLESGASATLLAAPGIFRLGLLPTGLAGDPVERVEGLGPRAVRMHRHAFKALQVGEQVIDGPKIWVAPIRLAPIVDMLLGVDWISKQHLWISFSTQQLFVAEP